MHIFVTPSRDVSKTKTPKAKTEDLRPPHRKRRPLIENEDPLIENEDPLIENEDPPDRKRRPFRLSSDLKTNSVKCLCQY